MSTADRELLLVVADSLGLMTDVMVFQEEALKGRNQKDLLDLCISQSDGC